MATYFFCNVIPSRTQSSQSPKINIKFLREDIGPSTIMSCSAMPYVKAISCFDTVKECVRQINNIVVAYPTLQSDVR